MKYRIERRKKFTKYGTYKPAWADKFTAMYSHDGAYWRCIPEGEELSSEKEAREVIKAYRDGYPSKLAVDIIEVE